MLQNRKPSGPAAEAVDEIVTGMGYSVLEFSAERVKGRTRVHCVLFHPDGINLDALGEVHATLQPRLETLLEDEDLHIEFSSPGVERTLKSFHEFTVFAGYEIQVLPADDTQWVHGTIFTADENRCVVRDQTGQEYTFTPETVKKARLSE